MKKSKKFLSILCAVCMVMAMAAPAFAASTGEEPRYDPEYVEGFGSQKDALARNALRLNRAFEESVCDIPCNSGSGTTGVIAVEFEADSTKAEFTLDCKYDGSYHCRLYRVHSSEPISPHGEAVMSSFGDGPTFKNLIIGETYRVMVSSQDVPTAGTSGTYTLDTLV
ncbi:MAG: hypothetical protein RRY64_08585 [Oscillospiraceae bacterium]